MKKVPLFIMLILFLFLTALSATADEARLPSGTSYSKSDRKSKTMLRNMKRHRLAWRQQSSTRTVPFTKITLAI